MMKRMILSGVVLMVGLAFVFPQTAAAYNYGDFRSTTLVSKAWQALGENDIDDVMAYVNKTSELYDDQAKKMQESLAEYPAGSKDEIFAYWALNDIATALYIQGEAYRSVEMKDEAREAYQKVIDQYTYGQCWDNGGWFWKPAEAAAEKIAMIESNSNLDFGDYASSTLTTKAWGVLSEKDLDAVVSYVDKCLELYAKKAGEMQGSLAEYLPAMPQSPFRPLPVTHGSSSRLRACPFP